MQFACRCIKKAWKIEKKWNIKPPYTGVVLHIHPYIWGSSFLKIPRREHRLGSIPIIDNLIRLFVINCRKSIICGSKNLGCESPFLVSRLVQFADRVQIGCRWSTKTWKIWKKWNCTPLYAGVIYHNYPYIWGLGTLHTDLVSVGCE